MTNPVQKIAVAGLLITMTVAAVMVVQLRGQQRAQIAGDFRDAAKAEVRDAAGQVLLAGSFAVAAQDAGEEGEVERVARLEALAGGSAAGEAEVEYQRETPGVQEVEFKVTGAQPGAVLSLVIDGTPVITATVDSSGNAEAEANVKAAGQ